MARLCARALCCSSFSCALRAHLLIDSGQAKAGTRTQLRTVRRRHVPQRGRGRREERRECGEIERERGTALEERGETTQTDEVPCGATKENSTPGASYVTVVVVVVVRRWASGARQRRRASVVRASRRRASVGDSERREESACACGGVVVAVVVIVRPSVV